MTRSPDRSASGRGGSGSGNSNSAGTATATGSPVRSPRLSPSRSRLVSTLQSPLSSARCRASSSSSSSASQGSGSAGATMSSTSARKRGVEEGDVGRRGGEQKDGLSPFQREIEKEGAAMGTGHSLEFEFIEIAIEDLVQWLNRAAFVFNDAMRPRPVHGVLDLNDDALQNTLAMANTNLRVETMRGLNDPNHFMPPLSQSQEEKEKEEEEVEVGVSLADHDMSVLSRIMLESLSAANIFDWYDKFAEDCLEWAPPRVTKKKKGRGGAGDSCSSSNSSTEEMADLKIMPCRFMRALSDLESTGLLKVHKGGSEISRVAYLWMGSGPS